MSLPESVWELESLVELNLTSAGLVGFSGRIESMKELKVLNLSYNSITTLPEGIESLVKLEELDVSFCFSLGQLPCEIGNLSSLRALNLRATGIVELLPSVSRFSHLQHLYGDSCLKLRQVEQLPASLYHLYLPYFSLQLVPDLSNLVSLVELALLSYEASFNHYGLPIEDRQTRFRYLDISWIAMLPKLKRMVIEVPSDALNSLQVDLRSLSSVELRLSCSDVQSLSQLPPNLSGLVLTKFRVKTLDRSLLQNLKNLAELFIDGLTSEEIELPGLESLGNLQKIDVWNCQSLRRLTISSCPKKLNFMAIMYCPKLAEVGGVNRLESLTMLWLSTCPVLSRLPDLWNLVETKELSMYNWGCLKNIPGLMRKEHAFNLVVINCGKLRGFVGSISAQRRSNQ